MAELWEILDANGNMTGRTIERGKPMGKGEYHLVVHVWIVNDSGEWLIAQCTPNKSFPNMWECVGGSAVAGDNSLTTALKEVREELGVTLESQNGRLFKRYQRNYYDESGDFVGLTHQSAGKDCGLINGVIIDVWLFRQNIDIVAVTLAPNETCGAMWASSAEINCMIDEGTFIGREIFTYIDELFKEN